MFLAKPTTVSVIKKQYKYKSKAYLDVYFSLVVLQVISILLSFAGANSMGVGTPTMNINITYFSVDIVIVFTMIWGFITAIQLTTKNYRNDDFSFVTNRVNSNISNGLFLLTASIIAGITAMLSTFLQKSVLYYIGGTNFIADMSLFDYAKQIIIGIGSGILYVLLFCALGYVVGTLVQLHKSFTFIIPASFFGILFIIESLGLYDLRTYLFEFLFSEPSFVIFTLKILSIVAVVFTCATLMSNKLEVR
ncbi:hypothetical protein GC105_11765 [Alkalibaculum sp. M08DMB]|uniref:Uncharacterized protein n=1 Tax=Alkalibaculum sporogenes TaxID=2655001 RepID=A0A6A7KBA4_9FIRM|nr:hypothetical protein [Alkalibaculum sporogenes]MPW26467.1 hypothetical protein [Alkalibaculum sporogenes]